jgi:predicted ArsR family transcriptional regulator
MMMTEQVWEDERLRGTEKLVALGLARLVDERGVAVVSLDDLADRLGLHRSTVRRTVRALEQAGAISVERTNRSPSRYVLTS